MSEDHDKKMGKKLRRGLEAEQSVSDVARKDGRYRVDAYHFLFEALEYTISKLPERRHVSGRELLDGIRQYALSQFGFLARTVLESWGVKRTEDFGELVFVLVDAGLLGKTDQDSRDDFKAVYDFKEAFDESFRFEPPPSDGE